MRRSRERLVVAAVCGGALLAGVSPAWSQSMMGGESTSLERLELLGGSVRGDIFSGDMTYSANEQGPARLRVHLAGGETYEIASETIERSSTAQRLTLAGKASIEGATVRIKANKIVYDMRKGHIDCPGPFELWMVHLGEERSFQGKDGWVTVVDGRFREFGALQATGVINPSDTDAPALPPGRRQSR